MPVNGARQRLRRPLDFGVFLSLFLWSAAAVQDSAVVNQYPVLSVDHRNVLGLRQSEYSAVGHQVGTIEKTGYLDLSHSWGSVEEAKENSLLTKHLVHPSDAGGRQISCEVQRAILPSRSIQCRLISGK